MKKQMLRFIVLTFFILFTSLYLMQLNNYNNYYENQKTILTDEAIKRFEEDVKNGKEIEEENYLIKEKNYNNSFSKIGMKISSIIEKRFNKTMNKIFKDINSVVNNE